MKEREIMQPDRRTYREQVLSAYPNAFRIFTDGMYRIATNSEVGGVILTDEHDSYHAAWRYAAEQLPNPDRPGFSRSGRKLTAGEVGYVAEDVKPVESSVKIESETAEQTLKKVYPGAVAKSGTYRGCVVCWIECVGVRLSGSIDADSERMAWQYAWENYMLNGTINLRLNATSEAPAVAHVPANSMPAADFLFIANMLDYARSNVEDPEWPHKAERELRDTRISMIQDKLRQVAWCQQIPSEEAVKNEKPQDSQPLTAEQEVKVRYPFAAIHIGKSGRWADPDPSDESGKVFENGFYNNDRDAWQAAWNSIKNNPGQMMLGDSPLSESKSQAAKSVVADPVPELRQPHEIAREEVIEHCRYMPKLYRVKHVYDYEHIGYRIGSESGREFFIGVWGSPEEAWIEARRSTHRSWSKKEWILIDEDDESDGEDNDA